MQLCNDVGSMTAISWKLGSDVDASSLIRVLEVYDEKLLPVALSKSYRRRQAEKMPRACSSEASGPRLVNRL